MPVPVLLKTMTSADISECMAFDQLKDTEYRERIESESMSEEEQLLLFKKSLGFKG